MPQGTTFFRARGCAKCGGKGLKRRIGVFEVMRMNAPLRQMVGSGARGEQIHAAAVAGGMLELRSDAAMKALENGAHAPGGMGKARLDLQRTLIELIKDVLGG